MHRGMIQAMNTERQRELIQRLNELAARRATEGAACARRDEARTAHARHRFQHDRDEAIAEFERQHAALVADYKAARESVYGRYEAEGTRCAQEEQGFAVQAAQELADVLAAARTLCQHRAHEILKAYREQKATPKNEYAAFKQQCLASAGEINALVIKAQSVVRRRCPWPDEASPAAPPVAGLSRQEYVDRFSAALGRAYELLIAIQNQPAARFIEDGWPLLIFLTALPITGYLSWLMLHSLGWFWAIPAAAIASLLVAVGSRQAARPYARKQTQLLIPDLQQAVAEARADLTAAMDAAKQSAHQARRQLAQRRDADLAAARLELKQARKEQKARYQARRREAEANFAAQRKTLEDKYERRLDQLDEKYPSQIEQLGQQFLQKHEELLAHLGQQLQASAAEREREQADLTAAWTGLRTELGQAASAINALCSRQFPAWTSSAWDSWQPISAENPSSAQKDAPAPEDVALLPLGRLRVEIPGEQDAAIEFPAVLSYPDRPSLVLEAAGAGREAATGALQNVMLRLLTTFPPGKVRFTIIDPVGLGQNFSAFMHLADYDEKLVTSRIWTEANHIQQRLADLTEHMENVIQKYLRNEFASIQEYNQRAGEVAEPFQILVVANFPANFSEEAARRLASIAASGARCGVYTLISTDSHLALPRNFALADLEAQAAPLVWDAERRQFRWKDDLLQKLPLELESPPGDERFTQIVRTVGRLAKDAARVEVPFEMVMPAADQWWSADSRGGIEVPLGRAGAKSLQFMRLGKGTSQHVLISGKTGSGKSTLLNALITNLAMHYSPRELEFYLIDFKKGVEFKAYAAQRLPHARVIAIESEREFGMSVLERLDQELKRRGDLFRKAGVQDLKAYREAVGGRGSRRAENESSAAQQELRPPETALAPMPRVLLIIDEFQEFFTSDDRIAHDAALLLDRLVRQGRAFGIHVLLGSQTLAGAYSLARSTLGQMAVRIALQCSEADAHLILSEDNAAARLLGRPGEAIYNDANGLIEGNHPFQVVWLSDQDRENHLRQIADLAERSGIRTPQAIVFEGSAAADPSENMPLRAVIESAAPAPRPAAFSAWLGAAVAIKDPTEAVFRPQSGGNLLIVGQSDELALGVLATGVISLAAQAGPVRGVASIIAPAENSPARLRRFYILDGTRPEAPEAGFWARLIDGAPLDASLIAPRDAASVIGDLAAEVSRRLASGDQEASEPIFVVIHNLARFRDLKKADDYAFEDAGEAAGKSLAAILRDGPGVGVHVLTWCDSYNNATRWLDRQALRDFEMRVLFQMSATDSSNLMDSPAASRLGGHTAIFYSEERGQAEKFRPYGLPPGDWLAWVAVRLTARQNAGA